MKRFSFSVSLVSDEESSLLRHLN